MSTPAEEFVKEWRAAEEAIKEAINASLKLFTERTGAIVTGVAVDVEVTSLASHADPRAKLSQVRWVHLRTTSGGE